MLNVVLDHGDVPVHFLPQRSDPQEIVGLVDSNVNEVDEKELKLKDIVSNCYYRKIVRIVSDVIIILIETYLTILMVYAVFTAIRNQNSFCMLAKARRMLIPHTNRNKM